MKTLFTYFFLIIVSVFGNLHAESISVEKTLTIDMENASFIDSAELPLSIYGCILFNDTILVSTDAGLLARYPENAEWNELIDYTADPDPNWAAIYSKVRNGESSYYPGLLTRRTGQNGFGLIQWIGLIPYDYKFTSNSAEVMDHHKLEDFYTHFDATGIGNSFITFGINSEEHDYIISYAKSDYSDYQRIYREPIEMKLLFDSLGAASECRPVVDPVNNCIWFVYSYYNKIYKLDFDGRILDSIVIEYNDFLVPRPPLSRLKTQAVFQEWLSKCTPIQQFAYVAPGYLVVQYSHTSWSPGQEFAELAGKTTKVWRVDKKPIDISVDTNWSLIQVQPDGTLFFTDMQSDSASDKSVSLYIARIVP